ncbi:MULTISPECIES: helix-turn-helix domain-containing protein [unclassified Rickettsia]|uniref:helix-turn-helix domain-containing protein n=1 Tax=unclassified Rickettsia TaxID=114295 RepID=UPI0020A1F972|nr:helix-turn-helix transcriptional regulator [Rickettsia endosymbiont of Ceutorhynchus assimilis]
MATLSAKLNELMTQKDINPTDIEKITGLSRNTIYSIIGGSSKNPGIQTIQQIAKALGVKVESLIIDEEEIQFDILNKEQITAFSGATSITTKLILIKNIDLSMNKMISLIQEVYQCALKGNSIEVQEHFAEYLIDRLI